MIASRPGSAGTVLFVLYNRQCRHNLAIGRWGIWAAIPGLGKGFMAIQNKKSVFKTAAKIKRLISINLLTIKRLNDILSSEVINMRGRDILKEVMTEKSLSNAELAKRLNVSNATIWERLNNKNVKDMPVSLMTTMLRAMDYKVIVVPANTRLPEGGYEVE